MQTTMPSSTVVSQLGRATLWKGNTVGGQTSWQLLHPIDAVSSAVSATLFACSKGERWHVVRTDDGRIVGSTVDLETRDVIEAVRVDLRQEMRELEHRLWGEFRREIREEGSATRRHFDVIAESLRDDIRLVAEGVVALDAKVEAMRKT